VLRHALNEGPCDPGNKAFFMGGEGIHAGQGVCLRAARSRDPHLIHIGHCLHELDFARSTAREADEVELALWYHDAVYNPYSSNNEERGADWACEFLNRHSASADRVARIRSHILATRHAVVPTSPDSQLVVDIDLSILAAGEATYAAFEENVRKEYRWVPALMFRHKRAEMLRSFLDRPLIYNTESFRDRYEAQARRNLAAAIAALDGS
jgi:predicted metal-dependent HD superfamily phosphohydrolase